MKSQFIKLTDDNALELYSKGYMERGCLVKYRFSEDTLDTYCLDKKENNWTIGLIYDIFIISFTDKNMLRVTVDENGFEEKPIPLYDLSVYTNVPTIPIERVNHLTHEIYLAKV